MSIGVPIKVLHEAEGHIITVETMMGEVYRGKLLEAEDNMNVQVGCLILIFYTYDEINEKKLFIFFKSSYNYSYCLW